MIMQQSQIQQQFENFQTIGFLKIQFANEREIAEVIQIIGN